MKFPKCDCGGELKQVGATMTLICQWCGEEYDVEELEELEAEEQPNPGINPTRLRSGERGA